MSIKTVMENKSPNSLYSIEKALSIKAHEWLLFIFQDK